LSRIKRPDSRLEIGEETWSLTSLQQRLVNTGGRLVKHARYYWLLLAESHLTRRLFLAMVRRIEALLHRRARVRWVGKKTGRRLQEGRRSVSEIVGEKGICWFFPYLEEAGMGVSGGPVAGMMKCGWSESSWEYNSRDQKIGKEIPIAMPRRLWPGTALWYPVAGNFRR